MDAFSLYNSLPGLANIAGQAWDAGQAAFQDAIGPDERERRRRAEQASLRAAAQEHLRRWRATPRATRSATINPQQAFIQQFGPAAQGLRLNRMINATDDALTRENDRRVKLAQAERERQHEKDMLILRLQAMND